MKTFEMDDVISPVVEYMQGESNDPAVLTIKGKPIAVLVPVEEGVDWESLSLSINPTFQRIIEESWQSIKTQGSISAEEMRRRFEEPSASED